MFRLLCSVIESFPDSRLYTLPMTCEILFQKVGFSNKKRHIHVHYCSTENTPQQERRPLSYKQGTYCFTEIEAILLHSPSSTLLWSLALTPSQAFNQVTFGTLFNTAMFPCKVVLSLLPKLKECTKSWKDPTILLTLFTANTVVDTNNNSALKWNSVLFHTSVFFVFLCSFHTSFSFYW